MCGCVNATVDDVIYEFGYVNASVGWVKFFQGG